MAMVVQSLTQRWRGPSQAVEDKLAQLEADYNDAVAKQDGALPL